MAPLRPFVGFPPPLVLAAVIGCVGLWTLIRVHIVDSLPDQGFFVKYTDVARQALAGNVPIDRLGDLSTGYLWTVALLTGPLGLGPCAIRTLQIVLVTVAALLCGTAAWRRWGNGAGLATMAVILLSRGVLLNATEIEPETVIFLLVSAALALVVGWETPRATAGAAALLGLAAVFRPSTLLPTTLMAVGVILYVAPRARLRTAAIFLAAIATPLLGARVATFALIGSWPPPMNPGTVFFEGWNPAATGYLGDAPAVVKDVEHGLGLPDGLHVAYRKVAARATGTEPSPAGANRFWAARALAFIQHHPASAFGLLARKGFLGLNSYDAWDLATLPRKAAALPRWPWLPFGFAAALAGLGATWGRGTPGHAALALFAIGGWAVMILFYVTSRQRNVVMPAIALLLGLAVHEIVRRWQAGSRRSVAIGVSAALAIGLILTWTGAAQREDLHTWSLRFALERALNDATRADAADRPTDRDSSLARAATCLDRQALHAAPATVIHQQVRAELRSGPSPQRRFDLALVLAEIGQWTEAAALLERLEADRYRPRRGARITSSVAFHLGRCRLALGNRQAALTSLRQALAEAPGEARTLALFALLSEATAPHQAASAKRELETIHDPFTARLAMARAWLDTGHPDLAASTIAAVDGALEERTRSHVRSW